MNMRTMQSLVTVLLITVLVCTSPAVAQEKQMEEVVQNSKEQVVNNLLHTRSVLLATNSISSNLDEIDYYLNETFDNGIPADWTTAANGATTIPWGILSEVNWGSGAEFITATPPFVGIDSDDIGEVPIDADLVTPEIVILANTYTDCFLMYDFSFRHYDIDAATFSYTIDGGTNWVEVFTTGANDYESKFFDILEVLGAAGGTIQFKWNYVANNSYHMAIDNVVIIGTNEDITSPVITLVDAPDEVFEGFNADFLVTVTDESGIAGANLQYHQWDHDNNTLMVDGYSGTIALTTVNGDTMAATIDGETVGYQVGDAVAFWFEAVDAAPNANASRLPAYETFFYFFDVITDEEAPKVDPLLSPAYTFVGDDADFMFEIIDAVTDVGAARLYYVDFDTAAATYGPVPGSTLHSINMMPGTDGIFTATIPGADYEVGDFIGYYLVVSDMWEPVNTDTLPGASGGEPKYNTYEVLSNPDVFWNFEADQGGFESSDETVWQWGNPEGAHAGSYPTPLAYSGNNVWATVVDGVYANHVDATITTTDAWVLESNAMLRFVNWYHTETWDGHNLQISTDLGETWTVLEPLEGYTDSNNEIQGLDNEDGWNGYKHAYWQIATFDLSAYEGSIVMFRLRFGTDGSGQRFGAAIDDFMLYGIKDSGELEGYITDSATGDPIENASVTVYLPGTITEVSRTVADQNGYYHLEILPYTFDVTARSYNYLNFTSSNVVIEENTLTTANLSMSSGIEVCPLEIHVWGDMDNTIPLENVAVSIPELDTLMVTGPNGIVDAGTVPHHAYTIILTSVPTGLQGYHDVTFNEIEVTDRSVPLNLYMPEILPPGNLNGTNGDGFIDLTWNPPADQFTPEELEAIPGRLEVLHEYYAEVLENGSDNDLKKLPQLKKEIFHLEQALLRYGNGSQLDELSDFQGYWIRINGNIWNDQPIQECFATISLSNGLEYTCEVAAEYGYDPDYRVWSNSVTLRPVPVTEYLFEEVDFDWTELNPDLGGVGVVAMDEGDDENSGFVNMDITFNFFGTNYTQIAICTNGWLSFIDETSVATSLTIPSFADPNGLLVPLNVDMDLENAVDDLKIWTYTDTENNRFIIQYYAKYYSDENEIYSFQVILNGDDNSAIYQYLSATEGWTVHDPAIGFESQDGTDGATYYNGYLEDNYAISFIPTTNCWAGIEGTLTDTDSGQPIAGVNVFAEGVNGLTTPPAQSDSDGFYQLPVLNRLLAPYTMTFIKDGYEVLVVEDVDWPSDNDYVLVLDTTLTSLSSDSPPVIVDADGNYDDRLMVTLAAPGTYMDIVSTTVDESSAKGLKDKKSSKEAKKQITTSSLDEIGDVLWYMLQYSTEETPWETYDIEGDTLFAPDGEFCEIPVILGSENENTYFYFQVSAWMTDPEGLVDSLQTQWVWDYTVYNMAPSTPPDFTVDVDSLEIIVNVTPPTTNIDGSDLVDIALYKVWMEEDGEYVEVTSSEIPELVFDVDEVGVYNFRITVEDEVPNVSEPSDNQLVVAGVPIIETSFEVGEWNNLVSEPLWELGTPEVGPDSAFSGSTAWATKLDGDYETNEFSRLKTVEPFIVNDENALITYYHWYEFDDDGNDGYNLSVSTDLGENWEVIQPVDLYPFQNIPGLNSESGFSSVSDGWQMVVFPIGQYMGNEVVISFNYGSDDQPEYRSGVAIDDLKIIGIEAMTYGTITGRVRECNASGAYLDSVNVIVEGWPGLLGMTDSNGEFSFEIPSGTWNISFQEEYHWPETETEISITEDEVANIGEVYMTYPEGNPGSTTLEINADPQWYPESITFNMENIGCGPMDYSVSFTMLDDGQGIQSSTENHVVPPEMKKNIPTEAFAFVSDLPVGPIINTNLDDTWDLIQSYIDIDTQTGATDNYGVGMGGTEFYIGGYYYGTLSTFDYDGTFQTQVPLDESMHGTEFDGLFGLGNDPDGYLYGGNNDGDIFKFLPDMSEVNTIGNILTMPVALTYDWDNNYIYASDHGNPFYRMQPNGTPEALAAPTSSAYGMAYVPLDPDGYTIYAHVETNPTAIIRYNPSTNTWDETPVATIYSLVGDDNCGDMACGERGDTFDFMTAKQGEDVDVADLWEGYDDGYFDWLIIEPSEGRIQPGISRQFTLTVDQSGFGEFDPAQMTTSTLLVSFRGPHFEDIDLILYAGWGSSAEEETQLPIEYALHQNYPNPFNPSTSIKFDLVEAQPVKLTVFNMLGQEVARLLDLQVEAGYHNVSFDASRLASGVYFYRLETPVYTKMKKMVMIK